MFWKDDRGPIQIKASSFKHRWKVRFRERSENVEAGTSSFIWYYNLIVAVLILKRLFKNLPWLCLSLNPSLIGQIWQDKQTKAVRNWKFFENDDSKISETDTLKWIVEISLKPGFWGIFLVLLIFLNKKPKIFGAI